MNGIVSSTFGIDRCEVANDDLVSQAIVYYGEQGLKLGRAALEQQYKSSHADIVLIFGPHEIFDGGASTPENIESGRGLIAASLSDNPKYFSRYVFAVAHEIGHVLTLLHEPNVDSCSLKDLTNKRQAGAEQWHQGIEGIRMSPDGESFFNKSSTEGNEQSSSLVPLMFPATLDRDKALISDRNYKKVQRLYEKLRW